MRHPNDAARPSALTALAAAIEQGEPLPAPASVAMPPAAPAPEPNGPAPFASFDAMRRAYEAEQQNAVPEPAPAPAPEKKAPAPQKAPKPRAAAPDPFTCNVNAGYVYFAGKCRSEDSDTDGLTGIRIEPAPDAPGVLIVGCNGHALVCMYDATGTASRPGTLYPDKAFLQAMKPKGGPGRLTINAQAVGTLTRPKDMTIRQEQITHDTFTYPDIFAFLARARRAKPLSGPLALPAMQLAALTCEGKTRGHIALYATEPLGPVFIRDLYAPDYLGIIMPLKLHDEVYPGDTGNDKPQTALDNDTCPVPAWAVRAAGLDKAPAPVEEPPAAPETKPIKAPENAEPAPVANAAAAAAPAPRKTRKARARVSIAANIASRKRGPAPAAEKAAPVAPAPVSLPDLAAPAPQIAPSLIIAPAWMAHAYQMHA